MQQTAYGTALFSWTDGERREEDPYAISRAVPRQRQWQLHVVATARGPFMSAFERRAAPFWRPVENQTVKEVSTLTI